MSKKKLMLLNFNGKWVKANASQTRKWQANKMAQCGLTVEQIADVLMLAPATVKWYLAYHDANKYRVVKAGGQDGGQ